MSKYVYVVTSTELGWDCVMGVYIAESADRVEAELCKEMGVDELPDQIIFHRERLYILDSNE